MLGKIPVYFSYIFLKLFYNPKWHQDTNGQKLLKDIERHITTLKNIIQPSNANIMPSKTYGTNGFFF